MRLFMQTSSCATLGCAFLCTHSEADRRHAPYGAYTCMLGKATLWNFCLASFSYVSKRNMLFPADSLSHILHVSPLRMFATPIQYLNTNSVFRQTNSVPSRIGFQYSVPGAKSFQNSVPGERILSPSLRGAVRNRELHNKGKGRWIGFG